MRSCGGEREVAAVPLASPLPARALRRVVSCALLLAPQGTERVTRAAERNYSRFGFGGSTKDGDGGTTRVFIGGPVLRRYPIDSGYMRRQERR